MLSRSWGKQRTGRVGRTVPTHMARRLGTMQMTITRFRGGSRSGRWARRGAVAFGTALAVLFSVSVPAGAATVIHVDQANAQLF